MRHYGFIHFPQDYAIYIWVIRAFRNQCVGENQHGYRTTYGF